MNQETNPSEERSCPKIKNVHTFEERLNEAIKLFVQKRSKREIQRITGVASRTLDRYEYFMRI
jgi:hypothetical protein